LTTRIECSQSKRFRRLATLRVLAGDQQAAAPLGEVTFSLSIGCRREGDTQSSCLGRTLRSCGAMRQHTSPAFFQDANYHNQIVKELQCADRSPHAAGVAGCTIGRCRLQPPEQGLAGCDST